MSSEYRKQNLFITIVSGLPRSGTSMMMHILAAGGMEIVVDHIREADEDNPKGYYELEKVKKLKDDASWVKDTYGKVFKVISMLLKDLPQSHTYKIIFMQRDMKEILSSQEIMLRRREKYSPESNDEKLEKSFVNHLKSVEKWLEKQGNMDVLYMNYNEIIHDVRPNISRVNEFLGGTLDVEKMVAVVDRTLYRSRPSS